MLAGRTRSSADEQTVQNTNITLKYANCVGNHQATAFKCLAPLKIQVEKFKAKDKQPAIDKTFKEDPTLGPIGMKLDTKVISYARNLEEKSSGLSSLEDNMPEDLQNN